MKRVILSVIISVILLPICVFGISAFAENSQTPIDTQNTYTTAERTDDDPFAEGEGNVSIEEKTPTFYYILAGVAGAIIIFAIAGFITSKNKK